VPKSEHVCGFPRCQDRETGEWFACKTIKKSKVGRIERYVARAGYESLSFLGLLRSLKREIDILRTVDHPNIIRLIDVFEDEKYLHVVCDCIDAIRYHAVFIESGCSDH
jgi:calcium-dependent protein kinase